VEGDENVDGFIFFTRASHCTHLEYDLNMIELIEVEMDCMKKFSSGCGMLNVQARPNVFGHERPSLFLWGEIWGRSTLYSPLYSTLRLQLVLRR